MTVTTDSMTDSMVVAVVTPLEQTSKSGDGIQCTLPKLTTRTLVMVFTTRILVMVFTTRTLVLVLPLHYFQFLSITIILKISTILLLLLLLLLPLFLVVLVNIAVQGRAHSPGGDISTWGTRGRYITRWGTRGGDITMWGDRLIIGNYTH